MAKETVDRFAIDNVEFVPDTRIGKLRGKSTPNSFVLVKNKSCLDFYRNWSGAKPRTIMEIGLFEGGSVVLMDKLFNPDRIVGIDIRKEPIEALELYRQNNDQLVTYYNCPQEKPETLSAARQNFPDGIDLVVDDGCHLYDQSRATFQMLFPMLTVGGKYVIEDWSWAHWRAYQDPEHQWTERSALTNLIFQIVVLAGAYPVISKVEILQEVVCITKGRGMLPQNPFDLKPLLRGREMPMI